MLLEKVDKNELIEYPNNKCKSGFLDLMLRKWFCNPFTDEGQLAVVLIALRIHRGYDNTILGFVRCVFVHRKLGYSTKS